MSFPTIQSVTSFAFPERSKSHPITLPEIDAGDLLIAFFVNHGDTILTNPTGGGDWTLVSLNNGNDVRFGVYWKKALAGEGGSVVDFSTEAAAKAAAQVYRVKGWRDSGSIIRDVNVAHGYSVPNAVITPEWLDPWAWDVEDTLWILAYGADGNGKVVAFPTRYTDGLYTEEGNGSGPSCSMASARRKNAVVVEPDDPNDPQQFVITAPEEWIAFTVAIRPAVV